MPSFKSLLSALALIAPFAAAQIGGHCGAPDTLQPNPLAKQYTGQTTGTINGSTFVVPITYAAARAIIPSQYPILKSQYKQWLPNLGANNYPAIVQIELHHDVYSKGKSLGASGDYLRASVSYPFVDRLKDGYSSFSYSTQVIISESNTAAISALAPYGYTVSPGYFSNCNPYEYENGTQSQPPKKRGIDQASWAETNTDLGNPDIAYRGLPSSTSPYSDNFMYNVTNQPAFGNKGSTCDHVTRMFNTKVSAAPYSPQYLYGNASALNPFYGPASKTIWTNVYGLKLDVAYHEQANVACSSLKGFHVVTA